MPYDPPTMKAKKGTAFVRKWFPRRARLMTPAPPRARRSARDGEGPSVGHGVSAALRRERHDQAFTAFVRIRHGRLSDDFQARLSANHRSGPVAVTFFIVDDGLHACSPFKPRRAAGSARGEARPSALGLGADSRVGAMDALLEVLVPSPFVFSDPSPLPPARR